MWEAMLLLAPSAFCVTLSSTPSLSAPPRWSSLVHSPSLPCSSQLVRPEVLRPPPNLAELEREAQLAGQHLVRSPEVLRSFCGGTGQLTERLPLLSNTETLELIQRAWFFITASEARRDLQAEANEAHFGGEALYSQPILHTAVLQRMRQTSSAETRRRTSVARGRGKIGTAPTGGTAAKQQTCAPEASDASAPLTDEGAKPRAATKCGVSTHWPSRDVAEMRELLPETMSDVEFRLRETIGRAAYSRLFAHNQGLIYKEVNSLLPNWREASVIEKADFLQEGAQGLLRALRLFDVRRGVAFSTYAVWHIRAYVLRAVRDKGRLVRLPQALQHDMKQIRRARYRFAVDHQGATPSAAQLAEMLSWSSERVQAAMTGLAQSACLSLDAEVGGTSRGGAASGAGAGSGASRALGDTVAAADGRCVLGRTGLLNHADAEGGLTVRDSFETTLAAAQRERDPRRVKITRLKYGLEDGREWTYPQLAERFQLTVDGARSIVRAEVAYLRKEKAKLLAEYY